MDPQINMKRGDEFRAMAEEPGERQRPKEVLMFHKSSLEAHFPAKIHL